MWRKKEHSPLRFDAIPIVVESFLYLTGTMALSFQISLSAASTGFPA